MSQRWAVIAVFTCFAALFLVCFFPVFFLGQQFGFRDAAHYYYPLYQKVQQEWEAGRVPLWEIEENAGMPLLGNPTAAVLYPPKILYTVLPYAWGARFYVVFHTALAFAAVLVLMRSWGTSWTGAGIAGISYAFGAPILFQSANIIYLVGAAWLPLGFHAVDQWGRRGRRWALLELAAVLAMLLLGGEPQSGYLLGLAGIGYAAGLAWERAAARALDRRVEESSRRKGLGILWLLLVVIGIAIYATAVMAGGCWTPRLRPHTRPASPLPWMEYFPLGVTAVWGLFGIGFLVRWRWKKRSPLGVAWVGLGLAATLSVLLAGAQLLPVLEFTQRTSRAAQSGPHDIYPFSLEPTRLAGLIWPNVLGNSFGGNDSWAERIRPPGSSPHLWVPSLYLGGLTLALALATMAVRRGTPWRIWLSIIVIVGVLGSLGKYTSPIWMARAIAEGHLPMAQGLQDHEPGPREITIDLNRVTPMLRPLIGQLGPLDTDMDTPIREDDFLRDGDGGIYWLLSMLLPGFRQFRYPAKLFTLTAMGLSALAGLGWDSLSRGGARRVTILIGLLLALSLVLLGAALIGRGPILAWFGSEQVGSLYGAPRPSAMYQAMVRGLAQGSVVLAIGLVAIRMAAVGRARAAGTLALVLVAADLGLANSHYVITIPQSALEGEPELLRVIREAERADPAPGPFRVHRMPIWNPIQWHSVASSDRSTEIVQWERGTLQPKYGIPYGLEYTHTVGVAELYEYEWFYGAFPWTIRDPKMARDLGVSVGDRVVYYPRRSFDMWNTRYFVVPMLSRWDDSFRGYAALLIDGKTIYPDAKTLRPSKGEDHTREWTEQKDYRVLRNLRPNSRAWVVHRYRSIDTPRALDPGKERQRAVKEITYDADPIWNDPRRRVFDWRDLVWIESNDLVSLTGAFSERSVESSEIVKVKYPSPTRVELDVHLETPGMVVLADIFYPGWELTIDGVPAPIYRANRAMRGAAVKKGDHHLVYTYNPASFRMGKILSGVGLVVMLVLAALCSLRPIELSIVARGEPESETMSEEGKS